MTGAAVVAAARGWLGTPYAHGASVRGAGTDCLGLIRGVWREVVGPEVGTVPRYTPDWGEAQGTEVLWDAALRLMVPVTGPGAGRVLLFRMRAGAVAKHLGIETGTGRFIHAWQGHGVVESALSGPWARRVVARFAYPGIGED